MPLIDSSARLALISAWNDSGGAFVNRLLDGHRCITAWPFELQLGTGLRCDTASMVILAKYRWPHFSNGTDASALFDLVIDDELKTALQRGEGNKFSDYPLSVEIERWRSRFVAMLGDEPSRRRIVAAYIDSFVMERERSLAGRKWVSGHCPSIIVDADEVFADFPDAKFVHVLRNPVPSLADFRQRHPAFDVNEFATRWKLVNDAALRARNARPQSVLLVRLENLLSDRESIMRRVAAHLELPYENSMLTPSWDGKMIDERAMGPFGGVPKIGSDHEDMVAASVSEVDRAILLHETANLLEDISRLAAGPP